MAASSPAPAPRCLPAVAGDTLTRDRFYVWDLAPGIEAGPDDAPPPGSPVIFGHILTWTEPASVAVPAIVP